MEIRLLSCLTKEERKLVKGLSIKKGLTIYKEGETCLGIGVVVKGKIDILSYSLDGKPLIYNSINPGGIFGNNLLFSNDGEYKGNVVAVEQTTLAIIKKDDLITLLQGNKEFLSEYLNICSNWAISLNRRIKVLSNESAEERVLIYLEINENKIEFKSITKLAEELCLTREALSRCVTRLEKKHIIHRDGKTIQRLK